MRARSLSLKLLPLTDLVPARGALLFWLSVTLLAGAYLRCERDTGSPIGYGRH
jgi:hypothetical protein